MPFVKYNGSQDVVPIWINGKAAPLEPSRIMEVRSSKQGRVVHYAQGANASDANAAAAAAQAAFPSWRQSSHEVRRNLLLKVAEIYEQRADELVQYQTDETSCTESYARFNIKLACRLLREFAASVTTALKGDIPPIAADGLGLVFKEPVGPVLIIPPWNSSVILSARGVAAAIAAGCTVVVKASELSPRTHLAVIEAFEEAGLPAGCVNLLQAARADAREVTEALISHPAIRKVEFIGSASVGRIIGQVAAKYLKPVLMELGGKGPAIVLKDADLPNAAQLCAFGAFIHHGQICFSTERIIVESSVAKEFSSLLQEVVSKNYSGSVGCAATQGGADHAKQILDEAKAHGARFLVGDNSVIEGTTASLTPTIITDVKPSDRIYDEETFGPSATLYVVHDADAAIELANKSAYGLNASIHTKDMYRAVELARRLEYGQVHMNSPTTYDQETMPVTGVKSSGWVVTTEPMVSVNSWCRRVLLFTAQSLAPLVSDLRVYSMI